MRRFLLPCSSCHVSKPRNKSLEWFQCEDMLENECVTLVWTTCSSTDALDQNVLCVFLWSGKRLISDATMPIKG